MRDIGIPKLLGWRWAPCAALVLGSLSFVGFVTLAIPEHIGNLASGGSSIKLGSHLSRTRTSADAAPGWTSDASENSKDAASSVSINPATRVATHAGGGDAFPRRGFTPPLDRPEQPAAAPPSFVPMPAPMPMPATPQPAAAPQQQAEAVPVPPPPPEPVAAQPDLPPPGSGPAPGPVTPEND